MIPQILQDEISELVNEFGSYFSNKKILVTGGAGFLGSWLCDVFVASGSELDCLDNFATSTHKNIEHLKGKMRLVASNVEDANLGSSDYEYIFHFSSRASPDEYTVHPIETLTSNSVGTMRILELAKTGGSVFVCASTSEIYGDPQIVPTPETYYGYTNSIGIRSCYDEGKRFAEALCMAYFRQNRVKVRLARIFNSYGPRIRADGPYGRALPRFIMQALKNEPITIYGDGKQTRSFCYVTDTISGILKLATLGSLDGEVFNIGNQNEITILALAEQVLQKTGSKSSITFSPLMQDDPKRRKPDIEKAKRMLGWSPTVALDLGLERTIDYFKS